MNVTYYPIIKKMSTIFNISVPDLTFSLLNSLYDTLNVDRYLGRSWPKDLSQADFENVEHLSNWYRHFTITKNLSKMYNTYKFQKILSDFDGRIKNISSSGVRWVSLSAEENDLVAAHVDLNISSSSCI